jgi:integrase
MEKAGIARGKGTHGFHLLRHTAGSLVHRRTGDLKLVQELLGHSRIETTGDIHVHVGDHTVGKAAEYCSLNLAKTLWSIECDPTGKRES